MNKKKTKKPVFLYIVIIVLALALAGLGILTFTSLNSLADLQVQVNQMQSTAQDIYNASQELMQKASRLDELTQEEQQLAQDSGTAEAADSRQALEEGTLSPSQGSSFTENTDESMDNLLSQINGLLPTDNGTWSVYVCNLMKDSEGVINEAPMQAASLIKLFIMGAVYENYSALASQYGQESLDSNLNAMITVSDNDAANTLVSWLGSGDTTAGMNKVNQFCLDHGYTSTSMGRLLLQSNENGENYTSVRDCGHFLKEIYQLCNGMMTDSTLSNADSMYYLLKMQTRTNKIPANLPEGVHTANKTGELSDVENDAAIIYDTANGVDLVICFMSQGLNNTAAAQASIAQNSRMIYGYYNE